MKTKKRIFAGLGCLLAACVLFAAFGPAAGAEPQAGELAVAERAASGISLIRERIAPADYAAQGVPAAAQSAYTVTAKVKTDDGLYPDEYQSVNFSLAWKNPISESVGEYLSLSSEGNRATVSLLKPFSVQILLKASAALDPSKEATVTFDYVKGFGGYSFYTADSLTERDGGITTYGSLKKVTANGQTVKVHLANISTHSLTGSDAKAGSWERPVLQFGKDVSFDSVGSVNNTVSAVAVSLKYTDAFIGKAYSDLEGDYKIGSQEITDTTPSQYGLLYGMATDRSGNGAPAYFFGGDATTSPDGGPASRFLSLLDAEENPIEATVTITLQYGAEVTLKFYLDVEVEALNIQTVETTQDSFFFWEE